MKTLVTYLLEVLACSGVLLAAYTILLERRVKFRWCRAYLLLSIPLAAVIPLLRIPVWPGKVVAAVPSVVIPEPTAWSGGEILAETPTITPEAVCGLLYLLGAAFLAALMCWQIVHIRRLRRGADITRTERFTLVRTQEKIASFSFFRSVYVWAQTPPIELQAILLHEASHVAHRHSVERIGMECFKALLWWNPFVWIAARRLTEAEEFEADSDVLAGGYDMEHYMNAIFRQLFGYSPEIANGLRDSLTKKRFKMMTTQTPSRHALLRLAGTLPVVAGLLCAFSFTTRAAVLTAPETAPADLAVAAAGQKQIQVSLHVTKDKQPLPGAIVLVRGSSAGTVTDSKGRARMTAPEGSVLEIAYVGCKTREVEVDGKKRNVSVVMKTDDSAKDQTTEAILTDDGAIRQTAPAKASDVRLNIILMNKDGKGFSSRNYAQGATVQVVGSERGVVADKEGNAMLDVPPGTVLEIKYPGYEPSALVVSELEKNYFVLLQAEGTTSTEAPIYSVDEDGVRQKPLYIIDGTECQFDPGLNTNRIASIVILKNEQAVALYGERGRNGVVVITTETEKELRERSTNAAVKSAESGKQLSNEEEPFLVAETMPIFQGQDLKGFREWVQSQVRYPETALKNNIQGRVVLSFVIERDGSVSSIQMLQSPDKNLSDEARRVIASSPAWTPGKQHGETVRVKYTLPVDFRIDDAAPNTKEEPFLIAETMPSFQDGDLNTFRMWVQQRLRYPVEALANNIQGRVVAMFVVEKDGTVSDIRMLQSPDKILSDEARRVIASSPAWTPGKQRGEVVRVRYTMPVDFRVTGAAPAADSPAPEKSANTAAEIVVVGYGTDKQ